MVGRQDVIARDELGDFVALVHRLLDKRIAAERPDNVKAGHV